MTVTDVYDRIIWSADVSDVRTMAEYLDQMPELRIVKVDASFVEDNGWEVFGMLRDRGLLAFDDGKLIEVPSKLEKRAKIHIRRGLKPWMLNCMAGGESSDILKDPDPEKIDGLKRFADACRESKIRACGVTVLTSKKPYVVAREFKRSSTDQVLYYVGLLEQCGFTDVVCSPEEAEAIRADSRFDSLDLNTPGIRLPGSDARDQARTDTPAGALRFATRIVVGSDITDKKKGAPGENLARVVANITA